MRRVRFPLALLSPVVLLLLTPAGVLAKDLKVEMRDSVFEPAQISIQAGDTITFTNSGQLPHTATSKDRSWDTGNVNPGESKTITFSEAGTSDYVCLYHESQGMAGKITVAAAAPVAAATAASPAAPSPVPEGSPAARPSPEGSPEVQEAQPQDPNATVPIGLKLFPFLSIGLVALFALVVGAGYIRNILSTTEGR